MKNRFGAVVVVAGIAAGAWWLGQEIRPRNAASQERLSSNQAVAFQLAAGSKQQKPDGKNTLRTPALVKFMRNKLAASQSVLEGLALEEFDKIGEGAKALTKLSAEEQWRVTEDPLYAQHSSEFVKAAKKLKTQADEKNLDGAALSYVQLTMTCIECHRFV